MPRVKTGIPEFDEMLHGGFMEGDAIMVAGAAGTGKSTLALQYLVNGISEFGDNGIYVTFEQLPDQIYRDAKNFGWDLRKLQDEDKLRVVCTSPNLLLEVDPQRHLLDEPLKEIRPRRIVIDSLSYLEMFVPERNLRKEAYRLVMYLKTKGLSQFLLWETPQALGQSLNITDVGLSFLVDTIVFLKFVEIQSSMRRAAMILKMRGSDHDKQLREFEISSKGFKVGPPFLEYEGIMSGQARKVSKSIDEVISKIDEILPEKTARGNDVPKRKGRKWS